MSKLDKTEPAFPQPKVWDASRAEYADTNQFPGMTLRDYLAAKAMHAIMCTPKPAFGHISSESLAEMAYQQADAMLKARQA